MKKIALFSVPRSGSTWLGQILNSSPEIAYRFQPNFAYSFPFQLTEKSTPEEIEVFYNELLKTKDSFVNAKISISSKKNIEFKKTKINHLVFKETHYINTVRNLIEKSDTKIIGLVRSPFAVISSWLKIPKEFDPNWSIEDEWKSARSKNEKLESNYFGFNRWKEATQLFIELKAEYPDRFYLLSYDDLLQNTELEINKMFEFFEINYSEQTELFIRKSTSTTTKDEDAYSIFKSKVKDDAWVNSLPEYIVEEIKDDSQFKKLNLKFKWI